MRPASTAESPQRRGEARSTGEARRDGVKPAGTGQGGVPMAVVTASKAHGGRVTDRGRLARDLAKMVEGEVRFDPGSQALYANDASIYRQVPIGAVTPPACAGRAGRARGLPQTRGAGARPWLRDRAGRPERNAAVVFDFSKYMNGIVSLDPGPDRPGPAGGDLRPAARCRRRAWPDVLGRPGHPRPLHARRDDRQQLLRHPLGHGRQDGRQRHRAGRRHLRRHPDDRRPDDDEQYARIVA